MKENRGSSGLTFTSVLQIAFIVLKLCKVINWSWLWVLSPMWISLVIFIGLAVLMVLIQRGK